MLLMPFPTLATVSQYEIQPLKNKPGFFYAKLEPLRTTYAY